ncbi:class II aldolase/adducin family protein [Diplocloster agilis]|nr:class II aldolase/adducin family protein [Suonthocola fibrivorans]
MKNRQQAEIVASYMRRTYAQGMTTSSGGNITLRDEDGDQWVTPSAIDKATVSQDLILKVDAQGKIEGKKPISSEYPFHRRVLETRPDLNAVYHAHPKAIVGFSFAQIAPDMKVIPKYSDYVGRINVAEYACPGTEDLAGNIAKEFADGCDAAILSNHGIVTGAGSVEEAFVKTELIERTARMEILAKSNGLEWIYPDHPDAYKNAAQQVHLMEEYEPEKPSEKELEARTLICKWANRAYKKNLCGTLDGSFAMRVTKNSFVITPANVDRMNMQPDDCVLIRAGKREKGKTPDDSAILFQTIFDTHADLNYALMASPVSIMVFAITDRDFPVKVIPESYQMLRELPKMEFGTWQNDPRKVAGQVRENRPVVLFRNDCLLSVGRSEFKSFDRLEVADYTAQSIFDSEMIGALVPLSKQAIKDIEDKFFKGEV